MYTTGYCVQYRQWQRGGFNQQRCSPSWRHSPYTQEGPRSHRALQGGTDALRSVLPEPQLVGLPRVRPPCDGHDAGALKTLGAHVVAVGECGLGVGRLPCSKKGSDKEVQSGIQSIHETAACQFRMRSTLPESPMDELPRRSAQRMTGLGVPGHSNASASTRPVGPAHAVQLPT